MGTKKSNKKKQNISQSVKVTKNSIVDKIPQTPETKTNFWIPLLLFLGLSFALYFQCIPYDYILDDKIVLSENSYTKKGFAGIWELLTTESFQGYFGEQKDLIEGGRYRPLSLITFAIEYQFAGLNPSVSHIGNLILYGFCSWLIFILLTKLFPIKDTDWWFSLAFIASIIFICHPVHSEAVANIKGRDEIMAMIFGLLSFIYAIKYVDTSKIFSLLFSGLFLFLGLLSKENVITLLAVIPLGLYLFRKVDFKPISKVTAVLFGTIIIYLLIRYSVIGYLFNNNEITDVMNNPFAGMSGIEKSATISYTLLEYLRLTVFPHPLTHDYYPYHIPIVDFTNWRALLSVIMHIMLLATSIFCLKKHKAIAFGILFYLATLSIVSNIFVGVGTFMNERFIFMSSLGICILVAYLLKNLIGNAIVAKVILGLILVAFSIKTFTRVPAWKTPLSLNMEAVKVSKNSARSNSFMATALFNNFLEEKDAKERTRLLTEAEKYADQAIRIIPDYSNGNLMKAGILAERYKMDRKLTPFLTELKPVILRKPQIGFITEFLQYLNDRANTAELTKFYYDIGYNQLIQQRGNLQWGTHYLNLGLSISPNDPYLNDAIQVVRQRTGRTN